MSSGTNSINYDELMEFLISRRLCCIMNPVVKVFKCSACLDCYKKIRPAISEIALDWEDTSVIFALIEWKIDE